jgi:hypothetical protein
MRSERRARGRAAARDTLLAQRRDDSLSLLFRQLNAKSPGGSRVCADAERTSNLYDDPIT